MIKKIATFILIFFVALISFEIFLRYSPYQYGTSPAIYDKDIGKWHKINYSGYTIKECYKNRYTFNEWGLPKSIYKYDPNRGDVILLGDSYVEALMIKTPNIIHNSLSKLYNNRYNFLNYGLFGTYPAQHYMILRKKVKSKKIKYILHFINVEDDLFEIKSKNSTSLSRPKVDIEFTTIDNYKIIMPRKKRFYDTISDFLGNYQIYTFVKRAIRFALDFKSSKKENKDSLNQDSVEDYTKEWINLKGSLHLINQYAKEINAKYRLIVSIKEDKNKKIIKEFLEKEGIDYIFLDEAAKDLGIKITIYKCDNHWDDLGHKNIAKIVKYNRLIE